MSNSKTTYPPAQRKLTTDSSIGPPTGVRRAHMMRSSIKEPQVFCTVTRSTYNDLPKKTKADILRVTGKQLETLKQELGPDLVMEINLVGSGPTNSPAGPSSDNAATSPKRPKRANNWMAKKEPTPEGLKSTDRHGRQSSHAIKVPDTPPKYNGKAPM